MTNEQVSLALMKEAMWIAVVPPGEEDKVDEGTYYAAEEDLENNPLHRCDWDEILEMLGL